MVTFKLLYSDLLRIKTLADILKGGMDNLSAKIESEGIKVEVIKKDYDDLFPEIIFTVKDPQRKDAKEEATHKA